MSRNRPTIGRLIGVIALLAVLLAGVRSGSNDWFKLIYTATFLWLVYALIAARYRGPSWFGRAAAGWPYFLMGFAPYSGPDKVHVVNRNLLGSFLLEILTGLLGVPDDLPRSFQSPGMTEVAAIFRDMIEANRSGIGHAGLTILFALAGGAVARRLARPVVEAGEGA